MEHTSKFQKVWGPPELGVQRGAFEWSCLKKGNRLLRRETC